MLSFAISGNTLTVTGAEFPNAYDMLAAEVTYQGVTCLTDYTSAT